MSTAILLPSFTPPAEVVSRVAEQGYAILSPEAVSCLSGCSPSMLAALAPSWNDLPLDAYLKDGGRYRRRRHSCFVFEHNRLQQAPHRAHWQPVDYNALHGGMQRWFEPVTSATLAQPAWSLLLSTIATTCSQLRGDAGKPAAWYIEAHQFRIDTVDGIGRPTPEGAHRDGVDFVAVLLVDRHAVKGGESRVFEADGPHGQRFTLTDPWSMLLLDDTRVIHESTPIQPTTPGGHRDSLVLTYRSGCFQAS